jgi:hypothetical protein
MATDKPGTDTSGPAASAGRSADTRITHEVADAVVAPGRTVTHGDPEGVQTNYGPGETVTLYVHEIEYLTAAGFLVEPDATAEGSSGAAGVNVKGSGPAVKPKDSTK